MRIFIFKIITTLNIKICVIKGNTYPQLGSSEFRALSNFINIVQCKIRGFIVDESFVMTSGVGKGFGQQARIAVNDGTQRVGNCGIVGQIIHKCTEIIFQDILLRKEWGIVRRLGPPKPKFGQTWVTLIIVMKEPNQTGG